jgi:hypothetical protein
VIHDEIGGNSSDARVLENAAMFLVMADEDVAEQLFVCVLDIEPQSLGCLEQLEFMRVLRTRVDHGQRNWSVNAQL